MTKHTITVNNRAYPYFMESKTGDEGEDVVHVRCPSANINQGFLKEDIPDLLLNLPGWIIERQKRKAKETYVRFRVHPNQKREIEKRAYNNGFENVSDYLRSVALQ